MSAKTSRMPVLFLGHGSPMNAIEDNDFTRALKKLGARLPRPKAVLCVSAHWLTEGSVIGGMERPRTIHDFGGFPDALYGIRYPAPGSPSLAARVRGLLGAEASVDDGEWGLDHGAWSVLRFLYPEADVPVVQLSVDMIAEPREKFDLGRRLRGLREEGILILGSGNVVHNLRRISFEEDAPAAPWAVEFDAWVKGRLEARDDEALLGDLSRAPSGDLAVPTPDHYDPLLYVLGAADEDEKPRFEYEGIQNGSISMRAVRFG
ncbi:MAG TPA: 4,5-DOPA dioxygenase extradiol [Elusimicrobiota bacterium]|nr:4,5-DOPA dioxygenase extradiol [Elusimicrobiota bacterium]